MAKAIKIKPFIILAAKYDKVCNELTIFVNLHLRNAVYFEKQLQQE